MKIPVYILPTPTPCGTKNLVKLFNGNDLFNVIRKIPGLGPISSESSSVETNQVTTALNHARKHFPNSFVIVIKDTSVTLVDICNIVDIIEKAISLNRSASYENSYYDSYDSYSHENSYDSYYDSHENSYYKSCKKKWDLCYLSKWLDRCDMFEEVAKTCCVSTLVRTFSPFGIQCIMFSPNGRDIVLGKKRMRNGKFFTPINLPLGDQLNINIEEKNIVAIATTPNLFDFNVLLSTNRLDSLKLSECRLGIEQEEEGRGAIPFIWFVIIVVSIVLVAWLFYTFIAKYMKPDIQEEIYRTRKVGG